MKKIKVLQFTIADSKGGSTQLILQYWKYIDRSRFHFDFVTMNKSLDFADKLKSEGCNIFYISCYAEENKEKFTEEMRKVLLEGSYDIVHLHTKFWKSFIVEGLAKEAGVKKIIVHAHNTGIDTLDERKRKAELQSHYKLLNELSEKIATDYWACSEMAADFLFGDRIPKQKIKIIKNAIELSKYKYNEQVRNKYREKLHITDECVIGNVGRFVYQKNQEFLLEVFDKLCLEQGNCGPGYKLLLVGSGDREKEYRDFVKERRLEDKVIFTGQRTDIAGLLQAMDIFCLPSRFEGFGIALIEAQAAGLHCIVSDKVPEDAMMDKSIVSIPLDIKIWKEKIMEFNIDEYRRCSKIPELIKGGYDIKKGIKKLEEGYLNL